MEFQHFCHDEHPLVFNEKLIYGEDCYGCNEPILGPSYSCLKCSKYYHHESCAELPLGLDHPLLPKHPLILFEKWRYYDIKEFTKCEVCKEYRSGYTYGCYRCDFHVHIGCASLPPTMEVEVHDHRLIAIWKSITFTCDLCGKEDKGMLYLCNPCGFLIHRSCAFYLQSVKVVRHNHPLHLAHSNLEVNQSDSRFCQLCVKKVDIHYGLYYCSKCEFVVHLDCSMDEGNREDIYICWNLKKRNPPSQKPC